MLQIISRQYTRELDAAGTYFYYANALSKSVFTSTVDVFWQTISDSITNPMTWDGTSIITRQYGDFTLDEFAAGDNIYIEMYNDVPVIPVTGTYTADILILSKTEMQLTNITLTSGLPVPSGTFSIKIYGVTALTAFKYRFGLIENSESTNYISKVDDNEQTYLVEGLTIGGAWKIGQAQGYSSWNAGGLSIRKITHPTTTNKQRFEISQTIINNPLYEAGTYDNLINNIPPDYLKGTKCLRHIVSYEAKPDLYNPNSTHGGVDAGLKGDTGWYDENFNGVIRTDTSTFDIDSIVITKGADVITSIDVTGCHVVMTIDSSINIFSSGNTKYVISHLFLNEDTSTYIDTSTNQIENFVLDRKLMTSGVSGGTGDYGIFQNIKSAVVANQLVIEFDLDYTAAQQTTLLDGKILLAVETQDHANTVGDSDAMCLKSVYDVTTYSTDDDTLLTWNDNRHFELPFNYDTEPIMGRKEVRLWLCDPVLTRCEFTTNDSLLNKVKLLYRVISTAGVEQELTIKTLDISSNTAIGNIRQVNFENNRGYILPSGDNRNDWNLTMLTTEVAPNQRYLFEIGSKLRWEDWIKLFNIETEFQDDFFDIAELQNNINQKWDKYKDDAGWSMQLVIVAEVENSDGVTTVFENTSVVEVYDWDKDENTIPLWTGSHELFEGAVSLGVGDAALLSQTADTKFVATFDCSPFELAVTTIYGILFLEEYRVGGEYKQVQINSLEAPKSGIALYPVTGETTAKLTIVDSQTVTIECMIKRSLINTDSQYHLCSRLGSTCIDEDFGDEGWDIIYNDPTSPFFGYGWLSVLSPLYGDSNTFIQHGDNQKMWKSTDGGYTWSDVTYLASPYNAGAIMSYSFDDGSTAIIYQGYDGVDFHRVLVTSSDFITFNTIVDEISIDFYYWVAIKDINNILIMTRDKLYQATDGSTFLEIHSISYPTDTLAQVYYNGSDIILFTREGVVYKSIDDGVSFDTYAVDVPILYNTFGGFLPAYSGNLFAYRIVVSSPYPCYIYKSTDGGENWVQLNTVALNTYLINQIDEDSDGIYVGANKNFYFSDDNGVTFTEIKDINDNSIPQGQIKITDDTKIIQNNSNVWAYVGGSIPCTIIKDVTGFILQEDGTYLLQENDDKLIIEE